MVRMSFNLLADMQTGTSAELATYVASVHKLIVIGVSQGRHTSDWQANIKINAS